MNDATTSTTVYARAEGGEAYNRRGFVKLSIDIDSVPGGAGGAALGATAKAYGWVAKAKSTQIGGAGAWGTTGGAGPSVHAVDQVGGRGGSLLALTQHAIAGRGGVGYGGPGTDGGAASSHLTFNDVITNPGSKATLNGTVRADAGSGGSSNIPRHITPGGAANASVDLTGSRWVSASAFATGGAGGHWVPGPTAFKQTGGDAAARAVARIDGTFSAATATAYAHAKSGGRAPYSSQVTDSRGKADATAIAIGQLGQAAKASTRAEGLSGTSRSEASTTSAAGFATAVKTTAQGEVGGWADTMAIVNVSGQSLKFTPLPTQESFVSATAAPTFFDILGALSANAEVKAALGGPTATVFAQALHHMAYAGDVKGAREYTNTSLFTINTLTLSGDLVLGLLDYIHSSGSISSIALNVAIDGGSVFDKSFTSLSAASSFFDDTAINLGDVRKTAALDVAVTVTLRADTETPSAAMTYMLGTTNDELDILPPAKPTALDLATASDTGVSNTDNVTNLFDPIISAMAEPFSNVTLYVDGAWAVTASIGADGRFTFPFEISLSDGMHVITAEATDAAGNKSALSDPFTVTIDTQIDAPSAPDLLAGSDTGVLNTDNLTNDTTPTVTGKGEAGATVTLFEGATALGKTKVNAAGTWVIASKALGAGTHALTAKQTDLAGNVSDLPGALTVTIDTTPPAAPGVTTLTPTVLLGTASPASRITVTEGATKLGSTIASAAGVWTIPAVFAPGAHAIDIIAADAAGNTAVTKRSVSIGSPGADTIAGGAGPDILSGLGGNDTYQVDHTGDLVIEYAGGGTDTVLASVSHALAAGARVEFLRASAGVSGLVLGGNETRNAITGSAGADTLDGLAGTDTLTGGAGADVFRISATSHSAMATSDLITDFSIAEGDLIDFGLIDAITATAGDDAFIFIGAGAFTALPGQLRSEVSGGITMVSGDVTGDGIADFAVRLAGAPTLGAGQIVL